jgi:hypothetical protein
MIYYLVTAQHAYTLTDYLGSWGKDLAGRFQVLPYDILTRVNSVRGGTFIFSDLERLRAPQLLAAALFWDQLAATGHARLLNDPRRVLTRLPLLQALYDRGLNPYNVRAITDSTRTLRLLLFVRRMDDHEGPRTTVSSDPEAIRKVKVELAMCGHAPRLLMEAEFCDTADAGGVYRKYGALRLGEHILPRHQFFSRNWAVKDTDLVEPALLEEQVRYLQTNPHEPAVREVFDVAGISYGRIDYGERDGKVVVWEVNTNPILMWPESKYKPEILPAYRYFAERLREVIEAVDQPAEAGPTLAVRWPEDLLEQMIRAAAHAEMPTTS